MKKYNLNLTEFEIEEAYHIEQIKERKKAGHFDFVKLMRVYENYYFEDDFLIREGKIKLTYNPNDIDDLPNLIGRVNSSKDSELLKFVRRYGEILNTNISIVNNEMFDRKSQIIYHF